MRCAAGVEKDERLEVSFEIKGDGDVDAEVLNQFHGVTFGDEVEDDATESPAPAPEAEDVPGDGYKWREDVLLRVMSANGIDESLRDEFVRHAVHFDNDDNMYLKKAEIEAAAEAWVASHSGDDNADDAEEEASEEESPAEEAAAEEADVDESTEEEETEEEAAEDTPEEESSEEASGEEESSAETKSCPICGTENEADAASCSSCGFDFD